jgi:alpha-glucosidase
VPWWRSAVLYQIYPRSFADSNGDGIGDLRGVIDHLAYLEWLGVDGVWLSPITVSPNADWGYDVADYCAVQPEFGTLSDLDELVGEARDRGIRVLLDLVPNHTSDRHPWFVDARRSRTARHRDWYVWADPKTDGSAPNNWVSSFGGPAWTLDQATGQYYLHNFLPEQPDLNWWNDEVRDTFDEILAFWFDRGVAGFRIDVCHMIIKDAELRDNPPAGVDDHGMARLFGQRSIYNANRPEVHDIIRRWRQLADTYDPPRVLIGETNVEDLEIMARYYGRGDDELHLAFNFPFINAAFDTDALRSVVERTERVLPPGAWPVWTGSNHDVSRLATRWASGDPIKIRAAIMMLLTLRGTPVLYEGDEIGLTDTTLSEEDLHDPVGRRFWPAYRGRDPVRTPMPWRDQPGGGFTDPSVKPWLPIGNLAAHNVTSQQHHPDSQLQLTRDLIALRKQTPDLQTGDSTQLPAPPGLWAWRRGHSITVALNLSDSHHTLDGLTGTIAIATDRTRDQETLSARLNLRPWEGAIVATTS